MAVSHTLTFTHSDGSASFQKSVTRSNEAGDKIDVSIAADTNKEISIAFPTAALDFIYIYCDKAITLKTNSTSAPDDTISLAAGVPLVWMKTSGIACPFTAAVTKIYATGTGSAQVLSFRILRDATP